MITAPHTILLGVLLAALVRQSSLAIVVFVALVVGFALWMIRDLTLNKARRARVREQERCRQLNAECAAREAALTFRLVEATDATALAAEVTRLRTKGWTLAGDLVVYDGCHVTLYGQPMTREPR